MLRGWGLPPDGHSALRRTPVSEMGQAVKRQAPGDSLPVASCSLGNSELATRPSAEGRKATTKAHTPGGGLPSASPHGSFESAKTSFAVGHQVMTEARQLPLRCQRASDQVR